MKPSKSQLVAAVLVLVIIVGVATGYTVLFTGGAGTEYSAPSGLTVTVSVDHDMSDRNPFLDNNTVRFGGSEYIEVSSTNDTSVTVSQIEGNTTVDNIQTNGSVIELNDSEANRLGVRGPMNSVEINDTTPDDNGADIKIGVTQDDTATLWIHGLENGTEYGLYNEQDDVFVSASTANDSGIAKFGVYDTGTYLHLKKNFTSNVTVVEETTEGGTPFLYALADDPETSYKVTVMDLPLSALPEYYESKIERALKEIFGIESSTTAEEEKEEMTDYYMNNEDAFTDYINDQVRNDSVNLTDYNVIQINLTIDNQTESMYWIGFVDDDEFAFTTIENDTKLEVDHTLELKDYAAVRASEELKILKEGYVESGDIPDMGYRARVRGMYGEDVESTLFEEG